VVDIDGTKHGAVDNTGAFIFVFNDGGSDRLGCFCDDEDDDDDDDDEDLGFVCFLKDESL
jgi:hypothetical protein